MKRALAALASTAALLTAMPARADERAARVQVTWHAPSECISQAALRQSVAKLASRDVIGDAPPYDFVLDGTMSYASGEWVASLELARVDGTKVGQRELRRSSPSCHSLDVPIALAIALMIDLSARAPEPPPPADAPKVAPPPPPPVVYRLPPPPSTPWRVEGEISGSLALGFRGAPTVGLSSSVGLRWKRLRTSAVGSFWLPFHVRDGDVGADVTAWQLGASACLALLGGDGFGIDGCASIAFGVLSVVGVGFSRVLDQAPLFATAGPELVVRSPRLGPLRAGLALGALVPLGRYRFYADTPSGPTDVLVIAPVIGTLSLQLGLASAEF